VNFRRLRGIIREAEREGQNPKRRALSKAAYVALGVATRKVLAEEMIDDLNRKRAKEAGVG
jgi:hypothetical protein